MNARLTAALGLFLLLTACQTTPTPGGSATPPPDTPDRTATALYEHVIASATALRLTALAPSATPGPSETGLPSATPPAAATTEPATAAPSSATPPAPSATPSEPAAGPTVTPAPGQPIIHFFTAAPDPINPGDPVQLSWSAAAEAVVIYRLDPQGRLTMPAYDVPLTGSLTITAPASQRNSVNFVLFATLGPATAQAGATVGIRCPDTWFFPNPPADCPAQPAAFSALVVQEFEHGRMLWLEAERRIYILYDNVRGPRYQIRADEWQPGQPESDPALTPPAGLFQPVRGFGVAWRDASAPEGTRARDYLGWATGPEYAAGQGAAQCAYAAKYATCYLSGPGGVVYELKPEGSGWAVWVGPP